MKRASLLLMIISLILLQGTGGVASAETSLPPSLVINEIQTNGPGSGTTLQEFIELVNVSSSQLEITGWKVVYTNSSGKNFDLIIFDAVTQVNPGAFILLVPLNTNQVFLPDISSKINYVPPSTSGIAASGGKLSLVNSLGIVLDSVQWTNVTSTDLPEVVYNPGDGKSTQRKVVKNLIAVTGLNKTDFEVLSVPTPQTGDPIVTPPPEPEPDPVPPPITEPDPTVDDPVNETPVTPSEPVTDPLPSEQPVAIVYRPILINELFIDPVSPETDANDEWVELFNPSTEAVDISGYAVFTGANASYKYVFPAGSSLAGLGYALVTSGSTPLSLSNGGGAAKVVSPDSQIFDTTSYGEAPAGQSWAKNSSGVWEWTTTPTQESVNIITAPLPPVIKAAAVSSAKAKKATTATKITAVKAATTKAASTKAKTTGTSSFDEPALIAAPTPIPGWLLAVFISLALLYVGYEYRFEFANTIYRLRNYRESRR